MQNINLWSSLHLHRKKIITCLLISFLGIAHLFAQRGNTNWFEAKGTNRGYLDNANKTVYRKANRFFSAGFFIAPLLSRYSLKYQDAFAADTSSSNFQLVNPSYSPGFALGFYSNFKVADFLDLRIHANASFYERRIEYVRADGEKVTQVVESPVVELPILIKYRSQVRGIQGMYMIAGIKPAFALASKEEGTDKLKTNDFDLSIEYGFGFDIFFSFFRFSPELRFSHGLMNQVKNAPENPFNAPIRRATTHTATLYLHFGG